MYFGNNGKVNVEVFLKDETGWLTQKAMAELLGKERSVITKHERNIFASDELDEKARYENETIWLTQKLMAALFDVTVPTINEQLSNVYRQGELVPEATIRKFRTVQQEGKRQVSREIDFYNLDAIISVGYRCLKATLIKR